MYGGVFFSICIVKMCEAALIIRFVIKLTVRYGLCVCVFALFRLHFILFGSIFFFSVFDFFLLLMFICHQCLCRFFSPFYFQNIGIVARSKIDAMKGKVWKKSISEQMRHSPIHWMYNICECCFAICWNELLAHWWTCLRSFSIISVGFVRVLCVCAVMREKRGVIAL